jgi:hypothetical protein
VNRAPGHKMRNHLHTPPCVLAWVTHPGTIPAQCCLTLVIKWAPLCSVCPTWQDALLRKGVNLCELTQDTVYMVSLCKYHTAFVMLSQRRPVLITHCKNRLDTGTNGFDVSLSKISPLRCLSANLYTVR